MNRRIPVLVFTALVGLLAACQNASSVPEERWIGTSTVEGDTLPLELEFSRLSGDLSGSYTVGAAHGSFAARLEGRALTGELQPSEDCTYELSGSMTSTVLEAAFAPRDCPGGQAGSWLLEKE